MSTVILCDNTGTATGTADIEDAHTGNGKLHQAYSIFVFRNKRSELLIQKRKHKRFNGLWANTCCSHTKEEDEFVDEGKQRLREELGFSCPLMEHIAFEYRAKDPRSDYVEHEYDTILIGDLEDGEEVDVQPNPDEVSDWKWIGIQELLEDMKHNRDDYAPWFLQALTMIFEQDANAGE